MLGRLMGCELEDVGDAEAHVLHIEHRSHEAPALAFGTTEDDVRQELHLDGLCAVAPAGFAAPARDVEGEEPRLVAPLLGERLLGEALSKCLPNLQICRSIAARSSTKRSLIHPHHALERLESRHSIVVERRTLRLHTELTLNGR